MFAKKNPQQCLVCTEPILRGTGGPVEVICPVCPAELDNQTLEAYLSLPPGVLVDVLEAQVGEVHGRGCRTALNADLDCSCGASEPETTVCADVDTTPELNFGAGR